MVYRLEGVETKDDPVDPSASSLKKVYRSPVYIYASLPVQKRDDPGLLVN